MRASLALTMRNADASLGERQLARPRQVRRELLQPKSAEVVRMEPARVGEAQLRGVGEGAAWRGLGGEGTRGSGAHRVVEL